MDRDLSNVVSLMAEAVDRLASALNHTSYCGNQYGRRCQCGVQDAEEAVRSLWEAVEEMEKKGTPRAVEALP